MNGRWQKWAALSKVEKKIIVQALFFLPWFAFLLRIYGYQPLKERLEQRQPVAGRVDPAGAKRIAYLIDLAAWYGIYPYDDTCLRKSLVLWWLLRQNGIVSDICFGVKKERDSLDAHAWVEQKELVLNDRQDVRHRFIVLKNR